MFISYFLWCVCTSHIWNIFRYNVFCCSTRTFNEPLDLASMQRLARKKISDETVRKISWVRKMYSQWRLHRNDVHSTETIMCDLDDHESITIENITFALTRFIREICKLDGMQFPAKTLYEVIVCVQFHLESIGLMWRLLSDEKFVDLRYTLDNVMKDRCALNVGGQARKADVLSETDIDFVVGDGTAWI